MYTLQNAELSVSVLDPVADVARLGSRYCTGGYIYQVTDAADGLLLSGPQYPDPEPPVFDGQGAPECFYMSLGAEGAPVGGEVACVGVGLVRRTSPREPFNVRFNPEVSEFVPWKVTEDAISITMETEHEFRSWAYALTRKLVLVGRRLHSCTAISNQGESHLPLRWFTHPFFPLTEDNVLCRFSTPVSMPENPGFAFNEEGFICRQVSHPWETEDWFQRLGYEPSGEGITIEQKHPILGELTVVIDYDPSLLPIWGNQNTFSIEPYLERTLMPGQATAWQVSYHF